jgi:hypothetical protein
MVVNDADETSAGIDKEQLSVLIVKFLTEVCHNVGGFRYQIGGTGQGTLGSLFGAQDEATFAEFLLLAGLARTVAFQISCDVTKIQLLCKIKMPCIEKQTRRKLTSARKESIHYLYLGREVVDSQTFDHRFRRRQLQPKMDGIPKTTLDDQLKRGNQVVRFPTRMSSRLQD